MDDDFDPLAPRQPSALAREIEALRDKVKDLTEARSRLPQPLFWSLFNSRIREIKERKEAERTIKAVLGEE
jgi:hypothetical protein